METQILGASLRGDVLSLRVGYSAQAIDRDRIFFMSIFDQPFWALALSPRRELVSITKKFVKRHSETARCGNARQPHANK
jgi:hypothetical protein